MREIKLFDYQEDMKSRIEEAFKSHQSVMAQMPTGTGKTVLLAAIVKNEERRTKNPCVWIVAHRRELVSQIQETISKFTTSDSSLIKSLSIQWLTKHYDDIKEEPGLIVIDEAHHALAKTYKEMWNRFPKAKFLGLTATPCRLSGMGFTDLFEVLVQSWDIPRFIRDGQLATYDFVSIKTDSATQELIDSLKKRGADGDYQNKEMDAVLNKRPSIERLYKSFHEFANDKKGIVYAINISHAKSIAQYYQEHGVNAVTIDSKTPTEERRRLIERFKQGSTDIQVLVNVDIFSEGFDCPDVEFVQLARPTLSLAKYLQMVGRGLRVAKGKNCCMIIDNVGLYRVFGLPSQAWDWRAMFEGCWKKDRKKETRRESEFFLVNGKEDTVPVENDTEMRLVMSHEDLLQSLQYKEFIDSKGDFAIVKLTDGKTTVVNRQGEQVIEPRNYNDMRLLEGGILFHRPRRKSVCYYDLLSKSEIYEGTNTTDIPTVVTLKCWEFIYYDGIYMSRTKEDFSLPYRPSQYDFHNYGYCLIYNMHRPTQIRCQVWIYKEGDAGMSLGSENSESVCFLRDDHEHVYWLCSILDGDNIVFMDGKEDYYLVDSNLKKTYLGCNNPKEEKEDLSVVMPRLGKKYRDKSIVRKKETERSDLQTLQQKLETNHVELYQAGKRWGLKLDGRVVVPPVYLQIGTPVGAYCAFEQMPRHWGVMTLKGKVLVDAKYEKVEIKDNHTALVTTVTGQTQEIRLR